MLNTEPKPIEILLIEDNKGDVLLTREAFKAGNIASNIQVAEDGEQALDILFKNQQYSDRPQPDLILLDLNLPKITGKEVLDIIKKDKTLKAIPVVVLTSSKSEKDIRESYDLYANSYIVKPSDIDQLSEIVVSIEKFWFNTAALPA